MPSRPHPEIAAVEPQDNGIWSGLNRLRFAAAIRAIGAQALDILRRNASQSLNDPPDAHGADLHAKRAASS